MRAWLLRGLLISLIGLGGYGALVIVGTELQTHAATYRAAVMQLLDQRGIAYRDIVVTDGCAPTYQFCRTYAGTVQVLAERELRGQIACRQRWTDCTLTLRNAGLVRAPLVDINAPLGLDLEVLRARLVLWFRDVTRKA
jgi:hypothetical protein